MGSLVQGKPLVHIDIWVANAGPLAQLLGNRLVLVDVSEGQSKITAQEEL